MRWDNHKKTVIAVQDVCTFKSIFKVLTLRQWQQFTSTTWSVFTLLHISQRQIQDLGVGVIPPPKKTRRLHVPKNGLQIKETGQEPLPLDPPMCTSHEMCKGLRE